MQVLNDREVDIAITARLNGVLQIKKLGFTKIHQLSPALGREPLYHYVNKKHSALVPRINKTILEMKKNGELKTIRERVVKQMENEAELY
jgi:polar amino acid transport system substrate-binding protein